MKALSWGALWLSILFALNVFEASGKNDLTAVPPILAFAGRSTLHFHSHNNQIGAAPESYFDQQLDHSTKSAGTFKQRYFSNDQFVNKGQNIHFLYIEGQSPADPSHVSDTNLPHVSLARTVNAKLWALEHRYYGNSAPYKEPVKADKLNYLTSQQALEDIADFIKAQDAKGKWVLFGAGYAGSLALWFRLKYPALSVGVVSSSAPVQTNLDFYPYQKNVDDAYYNYNWVCYNELRFAALAVRNLLQWEKGTNLLNDEFKFRPPIDDLRSDYKDYQNMFYNLITLIQLPVIYNKVNLGPYANGVGIDAVCQIMLNKTDKDAHKMFNLAQYMYTQLTGSFDSIPNSYTNTVTYLKKPGKDQNQVALRNTLWQHCNEFAQFTSTDYGNGLFFNTVPNDYFISLCIDVFGKEYNFDYIKAAVKKTRAVYPTKDGVYSGTNAVIINAGLDPMRDLGVSSGQDDSTKVYLAEQAGYAADFQPPMDSEPYSVTYARKLTTRTVKGWLKKNLDREDMIPMSKQQNAEEESKLREIKSWDAKLLKESEVDISKLPQPPKKDKNHNDQLDLLPPGPLALIKKKMGNSKEKLRLNAMNEHNGRTKRDLEHLERKELNQTKPGYAGDRDFPYFYTGFIAQDLDHFDQKERRKFLQRYFANHQYRREDNAPRFLVLGGKDDDEDYGISWLLVSEEFAHNQWAKDFQGVIYALEHRYYGYSIPVSTFTTENLQWLNTEQTLADIAVFINTINQQEQITNPKWILIGGGFAGTLAALFRQQYPDLSVGAVASSAPMQARVDFTEYLQKVESDIRQYGPQGCDGAFRRYFGWHRKHMLTKAGRLQIKIENYLCDDWTLDYIDEMDVQKFLTEKVSGRSWFAEYDNQDHEDMHYVCKATKQWDDEHGAGPEPRIQRKIRKLTNEQSKKKLVPKDDVNDDSDYDDESNESRSSDSGSGSQEEYECYRWESYKQLLSWDQDIFYPYYRTGLWQACNEWGWMKSTNYGYNIWESSMPINFWLDLCTDVFGNAYDDGHAHQRIKRTNQLYGGQDNYNGTNVVFVINGEDPWNALMVNNPLQKRAHVININGTSHCADMARPRSNDVQVLKDARKKIKGYVRYWVKN